MKFTATSLLALLVFISLNVQAQNPSGYKVLKQIKLPGDGGWDCVEFDSINRHLFISHSTKVQVLDVDKEEIVGEIPDTKGVHDIAIAYDLNKGFTSNGKDSSVTEFDLKTLKVIERIRINGSNPDIMLYDPFTHRVFVFNGKSKNATVINGKTGKEEGTIELDGKPEFAVSNGRGRIYVNLEDKNEVLAIDPKMMQIANRWKTGSGEEPSGLSYDATDNRLFIGCGNKIMVVLNAENGQLIQSYPIGDRMDGTAFNPKTKMVFSSNGDGTITAATQENADKYVNITNIPTQKGARTLALDTKKDRIYLPTAEFGPPETKKDGTKGRPSVLPGTFVILVVGKE